MVKEIHLLGLLLTVYIHSLTTGVVVNGQVAVYHWLFHRINSVIPKLPPSEEVHLQIETTTVRFFTFI